MMPSFRETVLLTTAGTLAYAVCHFYSDREREKTRKNELAMELAGLRNKCMESDESKENGWNFQPKKSDVFIVTYPKCGQRSLMVAQV